MKSQERARVDGVGSSKKCNNSFSTELQHHLVLEVHQVVAPCKNSKFNSRLKADPNLVCSRKNINK